MPEQTAQATSDVTYDLDLLRQSQQTWQQSAAVRAFYATLYRDILARLAPGPTLELGSGIGVFKEFLPDAITSDVAATPYVDLAVNAYNIARDTGRDDWGNLVALDVLHHLQRPLAFMESAAAALRPGGRILLIEPAATPWGILLYRLCHHEPIAPRRLRPPFNFPPDDKQGNFANMGMSVALFEHHRAEVGRAVADCSLRLVEHRYRDLITYFSTGGFSRPALLPVALIKALLRMESTLPQPFLRVCGLRSLTVIEKELPHYDYHTPRTL